MATNKTLLEKIIDENPTKPGLYSTEFMALVIRHIVAVIFVSIGAFTSNDHSQILIIAGISLLGVDAGIYTIARTYSKSKRLNYEIGTKKES